MSFWPRPATESVVLIHSLLGESKRWHFHLTSSFSWIFYSGRNVFSQIEWLDEESVMSNTAWNCPMQNKTISKNGDCTHAMNNTDTFPTHEDGHMYTQAYIFTFSIGLTCSYTITHKHRVRFFDYTGYVWGWCGYTVCLMCDHCVSLRGSVCEWWFGGFGLLWQQLPHRLAKALRSVLS